MKIFLFMLYSHETRLASKWIQSLLSISMKYSDFRSLTALALLPNSYFLQGLSSLNF
jgi:hypothetical protein